MNVELIIYNPNEDREISFGAYQFAHAGCGEISERYVQATDEYVLRCSCGLEIHLPRFGSATDTIMEIVIDGQSRKLEIGSFHSILAETIHVRTRDAV
ncbi:hypothetical protein EA658_12525 [Pseudoxanthomonas winnipegensis]|jgi:hypothetical protein|uniref:Uncharacterized protein n=1 Tax=Pseudoxanthomonas winnipegensis TaxID=2480810 RepID=A0ABY1WE28_9GAMM|nr:hypothetical protein [Pseudoxanthomonas winnipegensis]TAA11981.1 hypothetical protein EA659_01125 [Pseudoxanthomonas winnipegensis]TAA19655.1 hypothetical protein EA658_12525 [Pseudoxanthomonas winnipegensis]TAH70928.1 hypothetical protein EA657_14830 [Pseudoxanthomonas winnipegensis]